MKVYHTREGRLEPPLATEPSATQLVSNTQEFDPQVAWFGKLIAQHDRTVTHSCKTSCPQIDPIAFSFISRSDVPARVTQGLRKAICSYTYHLLPTPAPNIDLLRGSEWWREVQRNTACESNPWQRQRACPSLRRDNLLASKRSFQTLRQHSPVILKKPTAKLSERARGGMVVTTSKCISVFVQKSPSVKSSHALMPNLLFMCIDHIITAVCTHYLHTKAKSVAKPSCV